MWDDPALVNIASLDRSAVILKDTFLPSPYGIGIKQGNAELKAWVTHGSSSCQQDAFSGSSTSTSLSTCTRRSGRTSSRPKNTFGYTKRTVEECP